jgi:hypothetical protein
MPTALEEHAASRQIGSLEWLQRSGGHLTFGERCSMVLSAVPAIAEGFRLGRRAKKSGRQDIDLARLEPPDTAMVRASRQFLETHCHRPMINHSVRTAYWTLAVLEQHGELTGTRLETTWVAALLHDVGLEAPPERGDFSQAGVQALETLAREQGWSEEQTRDAGQAIATNLNTRVDSRRVGLIAWAMNVGGLGELGFGPNRAQLHPDRIAELEARFPREDLRATAMQLIADEVKRVPDGRFALLGRFFPLIVRP